ncbi:outer membrane protein transport protein [Flavobacterium sp. 20NA77.7]|uniref:Outer membrane protein transport protein n=1 Tax=Flavobacterium nakdongensis TaxID=3073563 RepID=A0ABY9R8Y4_9FLAO|nr:outer membrane protein transport protein [Flavobacterium sp. 20NA77.7]WMW77609.1 outer membrane protein transport protein [Flavobacterium sp. 20NA77.7]
MRKLFSLSLMTLASATMFAGGYRVSMQGQKQLAMGHTGVAVVNSAEVAFFNPAGMSFLDKKFNLSVGGNVLFAKTAFQNSMYNWQANTNNMGTPFSLYATYKINKFISAGLAVYTPYGSTVKWNQDWQGAHLVNNIKLEAIFVQPTVSFKVGDVFSIGGGPILATGGVKFDRNLSTNPLYSNNGQPTDVNLDAQGITAWGYNVGFMFKPAKDFTLGFDYRSEIIMEARGGAATFNDVPGFATAQLANTTFDADLPLPAEITAGISYKASDKWLFAFDYNHTKWSVYKALTVNFANGNVSNNPRNYKDSNSYRLGAQYIANDKFTFRAGWYFDQSPVQNGYFAPETPRNNSTGYTGGLTYKLNKNLGVDFSFLYLHFDEINNSYNYYYENGNAIPFGGTYKSSVFSPGVGVSYSF